MKGPAVPWFADDIRLCVAPRLQGRGEGKTEGKQKPKLKENHWVTSQHQDLPAGSLRAVARPLRGGACSAEAGALAAAT